jgi:hypothetical protein
MTNSRFTIVPSSQRFAFLLERSNPSQDAGIFRKIVSQSTIISMEDSAVAWRLSNTGRRDRIRVTEDESVATIEDIDIEDVSGDQPDSDSAFLAANTV